MKKLKLLGAMSAVFALVVAVFATTTTYGASVSVQSGDDNSSVTITRTISNVSNPVTNTFTYTLTADSSNPSGASGVPASATVVFNSTVPTSGTATATGTINFTGATFTKLGDYKYTVTETASSDATNYPLDSATHQNYDIIFSVRNEMNGQTPTGNLVVQVIPKAPLEFSSQVSRTYFEFTKNVAGDMADIDECFTFSVNIPTGNGVATGDSFKVDTSSTCSGNPATVTAGTAATIKIKHGDTVKIALDGTTNQLPVGASYTITESAASGYTTKVDGSNGSTVTKTAVATDDTNFNSANKTTFLNEKPGTTPTGIILRILPFVFLAILAGVGITFMVLKKQKNA